MAFAGLQARGPAPPIPRRPYYGLPADFVMPQGQRTYLTGKRRKEFGKGYVYGPSIPAADLGPQARKFLSGGAVRRTQTKSLGGLGLENIIVRRAQVGRIRRVRRPAGPGTPAQMFWRQMAGLAAAHARAI